MAVCGVYLVTCKPTGHRYVGSAEDIHHRWKIHLQELRQGDHHCYRLQMAFSQYRENNFELSVLEETTKANLTSREQHYLDTLKPELNHATKAGKRSPGRVAKVMTSVRLTPETLDTLKAFCFSLRKTQADIVEDALHEYFAARDYNPRLYYLNVTGDHMVLLEKRGDATKVLKVEARNGVPPEEVRLKYATSLKAPVELVVEGEPK